MVGLGSSVAESFLIDVVLLVVNTAITLLLVLGSILTAHHSLLLQLFFAHLVEPIFLVMTICHNTRDQLRVDIAEIDRITVLVHHHA